MKKDQATGQGKSQGTSRGSIQGTSQRKTQETSQGKIQETSQGKTQETLQGKTQETSQGKSQETSQEKTKETSEEKTQDTAQGIAQNKAQPVQEAQDRNTLRERRNVNKFIKEVYKITVHRAIQITLYIALLILVFLYGGDHSTNLILKIMLIIIIIPEALLIGLLFWGTKNENILALELAISACLAIAVYNLVLGFIGVFYFISKGKEAVIGAIACIFGLLALSIFQIMFQEIVLILEIKKAIFDLQVQAMEAQSPQNIIYEMASRIRNSILTHQ